MEKQNEQQLNRFKIERENVLCLFVKESLKDSISEALLSDIQDKNVNLWKELWRISKVTDKDDIKRLKSFLKDNKDNLGPTLYDELKSEINEIKDDFNWRRSKEGQDILEIDDWRKEAMLRLSEEYPNALIYIGRSWINPTELIVGGVVNDDDEQKFFENYFNSQNPPVPIHFKIIVQNEE